MEPWRLPETQRLLRDARLRVSEVDDDREAVGLLREAGQNALATFDLIVADELWERAAAGVGRGPTPEEWEALEQLMDLGLAPLLEALGDRLDPPAEALMAEIVRELMLQEDAARRGNADAAAEARARVFEARDDLVVFAERLRTVLQATESVGPSTARRVLGRAVDEASQVAEVLGPVGVAAGLFAVLPTVAVGVVFAPAAAAVTGLGLKRLKDRVVTERANDTRRREAERAARAIVRLENATDVDEPCGAAELIGHCWEADAAIRRGLAVGALAPSGARAALDALRRLREGAWDASPERVRALVFEARSAAFP